MKTLLDLLVERADQDADGLAYRYLADGTPRTAVDLTYRDLHERATALAHVIRQTIPSSRGARVVLALDPGLEYVIAVYGILLANAVVVPAFPPDGKRTAKRFLSILADSAPQMVLTEPRFADRVEEIVLGLPVEAPRPQWSFGLPAGQPDQRLPADCAGSDIAFVQYTSGSTGDPKGIVITHDNVVSNCEVLACHSGIDENRVGFSWLPPYHDMGLMGTILFALYGGWPLVLMSPMHFVQEPSRWLRALSHYRATISVAPSFAFDLCSDHIDDDDLLDLDLSSLKQMFCGSEPVHAATLHRFHHRFAPFGYDARATIPCYGLAEATLFVTGKPVGDELRYQLLDRAELENGHAVPLVEDVETAVTVMSCGKVAEGHIVVTVGADGLPTDSGSVGEIWVRGPNVAAGYLNRPQLTEYTFGAKLDGQRYLRTGDLGFFLQDELFVTGRIKDLVVIAGRNIYPQDVERTVREAHEQVRLAVAFGIADGDDEALVVVAEHRGSDADRLAEREIISAKIAQAVAAEHGIRPFAIRLTAVGGIQTTTSGKVRRRATRDLFLSGALRGSTTPATTVSR